MFNISGDLEARMFAITTTTVDTAAQVSLKLTASAFYLTEVINISNQYQLIYLTQYKLQSPIEFQAINQQFLPSNF